jgi:hypothetical protein
VSCCGRSFSLARPSPSRRCWEPRIGRAKHCFLRVWTGWARRKCAIAHKPVGKVYLPSALEPEPALTLYARSRGTAEAVAPSVRDLVNGIDARVPIVEMGSLRSFNERSMGVGRGHAGDRRRFHQVERCVGVRRPRGPPALLREYDLAETGRDVWP